jgi:hypothetical protein
VRLVASSGHDERVRRWSRTFWNQFLWFVVSNLYDRNCSGGDLRCLVVVFLQLVNRTDCIHAMQRKWIGRADCLNSLLVDFDMDL